LTCRGRSGDARKLQGPLCLEVVTRTSQPITGRLKTTASSREYGIAGACLDFCVLRHSMSTKKDMYATQDDEESDSPSIGTAA